MHLRYVDSDNFGCVLANIFLWNNLFEKKNVLDIVDE